VRDSVRRRLVEVAAPIGASAVVLVFALVRGAKDSMWMDEAFSVAAAQRPLRSLVEFVLTREPNMGPYYLTLWGWIRIDDGDLWVRFLSALCTVAAMWAVWLFVQRRSGSGPAGLAVVVFAMTPFVLAWSMQARGYTMAMAFAAWSLVFADRIRTGDGRWSALLFGVMVGLGVASQFATVFVFVGVVVALVALAPTRATLRSLVMSALAATVVFIPFSIAAILKPDHASWVPDLTIKRFLEEIDKTASGLGWVAVLGSGVVCLVVASVRTVRVRPYLMPLVGAVTGVVGLVLFSVLVRPLLVDRYLIGCLPLLVVAAAGGWTVLWSRWRVTVVVAVVGLLAMNLVTSIDRTRPKREDFRSATARIVENAVPGDAIIALPSYAVVGVARYLPDGTSADRLVASTDEADSWVIVDAAGTAVRPRRLWIVVRDPSPPLRTWVDSNYPVLLDEGWYGELRLQLRSVAGG